MSAPQNFVGRFLLTFYIIMLYCYLASDIENLKKGGDKMINPKKWMDALSKKIQYLNNKCREKISLPTKTKREAKKSLLTRWYLLQKEKYGKATDCIVIVVLACLIITVTAIFKNPGIYRLSAKTEMWTIYSLIGIATIILLLKSGGGQAGKIIFSWFKGRWGDLVNLFAWPGVIFAGLVMFNIFLWLVFPGSWNAWFENKRWFFASSLLILTIPIFVRTKTIGGYTVAAILSFLMTGGFMRHNEIPPSIAYVGNFSQTQTREVKELPCPARKGDFWIAAPASGYGECVGIPNNSSAKFRADFKVSMQRMDTMEEYPNVDYKTFSIQNFKGVRFKSLTGKDKQVLMRIEPKS